MRTQSRKLVAASACLLLGALTACGSASKGGSSNSGSADIVAQARKVDSVASRVPQDIKSAGVLNVATDPNYPPFEYYASDNKTLTGLDIDLGHALGKVMGVDVRFNAVSFDGIIPGIAAGKYQAAMSFLGDIKERQKTVDFADYLQDTTSLMVKSGNPKKLSITDLCGRTIAIQKGSTQDTKILPALSQKCLAEGKSAITGDAYPGQDQANLAVTSGRADGSILVTSVATRVVDGSNGQLERVSGEGIYPKRYGVVVPKGSPLGPVIQAALQELDKQGVYEKILEKWKQTPGAIKDFTLNDPNAQ